MLNRSNFQVPDLTLDLFGTTQVVLRSFNDGDLPNIMDVERRASDFGWSEKNFRDSLASSHLCVGIFTASSCLAHAVFSMAADEAELLILAVDPSCRRRKLASRLLLAMEELLKDYVSQLFLEVRKSNTGALHLYESLGFNCLGERRGYYPPSDRSKGREDALLYAKQLADFAQNK